MVARSYGQYCGMSRALELVGERWALLIVRDLLVGPRRYGELQRGLPGIPTNILASRLKELQEAGILRRIPRTRQIVYELTPSGLALEDVVLALGRWGFTRMGDPVEGQVVTPASMTIAFRTAFRADVAATLPPTRYAALLGPTTLRLDVAAGRLAVAETDDGDADLRFATGPGIRRVISGELAPAAAIADATVRILDGPPELLERFARTFHLAA